MAPREAQDVRPRGALPRVELELPCRADSPSVARREMVRLEPELGHAMVARVRVVVTEIVSNCVWSGSGGSVVVAVTAEASIVRGEVVELSPERAQLRPDPDPFPRGGFGLLLVRRLADRSGALEDRRGTWFEIDRPTTR